jgi:uncharacterized membrane protein
MQVLLFDRQSDVGQFALRRALQVASCYTPEQIAWVASKARGRFFLTILWAGTRCFLNAEDEAGVLGELGPRLVKAYELPAGERPTAVLTSITAPDALRGRLEAAIQALTAATGMVAELVAERLARLAAVPVPASLT